MNKKVRTTLFSVRSIRSALPFWADVCGHEDRSDKLNKKIMNFRFMAKRKRPTEMSMIINQHKGAQVHPTAAHPTAAGVAMVRPKGCNRPRDHPTGTFDARPDDSAGFLVRLEQILDGDVQGACVLVRLHSEIEDGVVDGAIHPAANAGIGLRPRGVSRARDVAEQPVLGAEGGEECLPLGVVGALEAEDDRSVLLHIDGGVGSEDRGARASPRAPGGWAPRIPEAVEAAEDFVMVGAAKKTSRMAARQEEAWRRLRCDEKSAARREDGATQIAARREVGGVMVRWRTPLGRTHGKREKRSALDGECGFLAANLYAKSVFGEDALVNISIEKQFDGKLSGYIRIRSKTQGIALSLGDKITLKQKGGS
ncbi:hypothetical protein GUJ93_ZPchr0001g33171 [Zizania palustris]|uniref:Coatomer beta subunit appendage platform domain-containing protein n=1 Tax=Zizania palustris TaxID=103762 RepID=A0A8J5SBB1_ZIZPA|nr:hypothetical protein GUJ93_ZPchr0001g33171 [Zizania palustris]